MLRVGGAFERHARAKERESEREREIRRSREPLIERININDRASEWKYEKVNGTAAAG